MYDSIKKITFFIDFINVIGIIWLIRTLYQIRRRAPFSDEIEELLWGFILFAFLSIMLFIVTYILRRVIQEMSDESMSVMRRMSELEKKLENNKEQR